MGGSGFNSESGQQDFNNSNRICLLKIPSFFLLLLPPPYISNLKRLFISLFSKEFLQFFFMASFAISIFSSSSFALTFKNYRPFLSPTAFSLKPISIKASSASLDCRTPYSVIEQNPLKPTKVKRYYLVENLMENFSIIKL